MVLVTGASGHVGGALVRALLDEGRDVRCLVHRDTRSLEGLSVARVTGDVTEPSSLGPAFEGVDVVFHCAAVISIVGPMGGRVRRVNVDGVRNVALAARAARVRRLVHVSSCHAYDLRVPRVHEEGPRAGPGSFAYDRSKADGEAALREVADLDATIVNPGACIGPYDFAPSRLGKTFLDLRDRRLPALVRGGFHFIDTRDVAQAIIAAETLGGTGENHLLGGWYHTVDALLAEAARVVGVRPPRFVAPLWLARLGAPFAQALDQLRGQQPLFTRESMATLAIPPRNFDQSKALRVLGLSCRPTSETLHDLYEDFARRGV